MRTTSIALTNWAGNVRYGAARVHRPETLAELRRLVADRPRIRALGSRHSFSLIADSEHDLVCLDAMPAAVEIDPTAGTATVGAGLRYADVAPQLHRAGYALANLASLPHISIGGSCATGTHGSGNTGRCLAAAVSALEMVNADGDVIRLSRADDPHRFPGAVVALGALGVVTRLTLDLEPAFEVAQSVRHHVPLDEVADRFDDVSGAAYSVSVFTDWRSGDADVWLKHRPDRTAGGWTGGQAATRPSHPVPGMSPESSTEQMGVAGPWYQRLPHFRPELVPGAGEELQSEYYLPRELAADAIAAIRGIGDAVAAVLHISEIRTVRADDLWLSPAYGRDSVTLHFTWIKDPAAVQPVLSAVEDRLLPLGARPHWGKLTLAGPADVLAGYPRGDDFADLVDECDPTGKFRNDYVDQLLGRLAVR